MLEGLAGKIAARIVADEFANAPPLLATASTADVVVINTLCRSYRLKFKAIALDMLYVSAGSHLVGDPAIFQIEPALVPLQLEHARRFAFFRAFDLFDDSLKQLVDCFRTNIQERKSWFDFRFLPVPEPRNGILDSRQRLAVAEAVPRKLMDQIPIGQLALGRPVASDFDDQPI
jgi:hypothetical protein